ncbi:MerR family transcriptional regulator [Actinomadura physcomitrii]|uniref:MerR family transcriptional regulator n=1 Tax=Actinomadura physcomitrii TaxID=2650748 RepID=UPI001F1CF512|nr:MerR family transcriptional regulator [Actinomadura physcomitrii]
MDVAWTIGELAERAVAVLAAGESAQVNGRIRDLPNERLIRWYTTIGLVDPPAGRRGRTALYGPRHLLQLVAVKRRQAAGRSIAEIQLELAAATDAVLERIAALPPGAMDQQAEAPIPTIAGTAEPASQSTASAANPRTAESVPDAGTTASAPRTAPPDSTRQSTGPSPEAAPSDDAAPPTKSAGTEPDTQPAADGARQADGEARTRARFWNARPDVSFGRAAVAEDFPRPLPPVVQGVRLAPDLTLLLEAGPLSADDLRAIETAARPLLDELAARGLIASPADSARMPADPPRRPQ